MKKGGHFPIRFYDTGDNFFRKQENMKIITVNLHAEEYVPETNGAINTVRLHGRRSKG